MPRRDCVVHHRKEKKKGKVKGGRNAGKSSKNTEEQREYLKEEGN